MRARQRHGAWDLARARGRVGSRERRGGEMRRIAELELGREGHEMRAAELEQGREGRGESARPSESKGEKAAELEQGREGSRAARERRGRERSRRGRVQRGRERRGGDPRGREGETSCTSSRKPSAAIASPRNSKFKPPKKKNLNFEF